MMKKKSTAVLLTLCLALFLAACSAGGGGASEQTREPSQTAETPTAESAETPTQPDESTEEPTEDSGDGADVVRPVDAEPIEFDVDHTNKDENGAVLGTATVPADGYYFFAARTAPMSEDAEVTITSDLPIPMDSATVPAEAFTNGYDLCAMMELTAGDYTVAVGNAMYAIDLIPVQMVDTLAGAFAKDGVYVCRLAEPVTVTFSESDNNFVQFYGGNENEFLQMLEPTETSAVEFPAGIAVIDTRDFYDTLSSTAS